MTSDTPQSTIYRCVSILKSSKERNGSDYLVMNNKEFIKLHLECNANIADEVGTISSRLFKGEFSEDKRTELAEVLSLAFEGMDLKTSSNLLSLLIGDIDRKIRLAEKMAQEEISKQITEEIVINEIGYLASDMERFDKVRTGEVVIKSPLVSRVFQTTNQGERSHNFQTVVMKVTDGITNSKLWRKFQTARERMAY